MPATGRWTPCSRSKTHSPPGCIRRSATCSPRGRPALLRHHLHPLLTRRTRSAGDPRRARPSARRRGGRHSRNTATTPTDPRISQGSRPTRDRTLSRVTPDHGNVPHQARRTRDGPLDGRPVPAAVRRTAGGTDPPSCIARRASTVISPIARVRIGLVALVLVAAGCGSKGSNESSEGAGGGQSSTLTLGASLSLTGSLAREGQLTKEGYELCKQRVNAKGGVDLGGRKVRLDIKYQDDASQPDTAAQLVDQFNDQGLKLILGPYGSARRRRPRLCWSATAKLWPTPPARTTRSSRRATSGSSPSSLRQRSTPHQSSRPSMSWRSPSRRPSRFSRPTTASRRP